MATKEAAPTLATAISEAMDTQGISNRRLGPMLGVTREAVRYWRNGSLPEPYRLDQLADILDLDPDELWEMFRRQVRAEAPPKRRGGPLDSRHHGTLEVPGR